ncbi:MAG TPA: corrinoid protein [Candidatus Bathyarchaeia archaeon]|nr:corrinoid protein [Candidatus Bathyarchaeia archaeon]
MGSANCLNDVNNAVIAGDVEAVEKLVKEALSSGIEPIDVLRNGLERGLTTLGQKWIEGEVFLPHIMLAADAMKAGMVILKPALEKTRSGDALNRGTVVIGTVYGDIHSIGKDFVAMMLEVSGFVVYDLGVSVSPISFVEKAEEVKADIIALSCLLSPSLYYQKDVIAYLKDMGARGKYLIMVGGAPVTQEWIQEIGSDGYARTALEAAEVARQLMKKKREAKLPA